MISFFFSFFVICKFVTLIIKKYPQKRALVQILEKKSLKTQQQQQEGEKKKRSRRVGGRREKTN